MKPCRLILICVASFACALAARAANDVWTGGGLLPPHGDWILNANWLDNSAPGNSDTATFDVDSDYTVSLLATPPAVQSLTVSHGNVTFAGGLLPGTEALRANVSGTAQDVVLIGPTTVVKVGNSALASLDLVAGDDLSIQSDASLTIEFGSVTAADFSTSGLNGSIFVDGPGARLALTDAGANNFVGRSGNDGYLFLTHGTTGSSIAGNLGIADSSSANSLGLVTIVAGSTLSLGGNLTLANQKMAGQSATIEIYDAGSSLTQAGATSIVVGSAAEGTATINIGSFGDGGALTTGTGPMTINATGSVTVGVGGNQGVLNARGDLQIVGGTLNIGPAGDVLASGNVTLSSGSIQGPAGRFHLAENRTMTIQNGGNATFSGDLATPTGSAVEISGVGAKLSTGGSLAVGAGATISASEGATLTVGLGTLVIENGGNLALAAGAVVDVRGAIQLNGGTFTFAGGTLHVDQVEGTLINQGGTLAPGHVVGATTVHGDYRQQSAAALEIELSGTSLGADFDTLAISGAAELAGALRVSLLNALVPSPGDAFAIVTAAGPIVGTFDNVSLSPLAGGLALAVQYSAHEVTIFTQGVLGDYSRNGVVDSADYTIWRNEFGRTGEGLAADGNRNGQVDGGDYVVWKSHYGEVALAGGSGIAIVSVPEPSSVAICVIGILSLCRRRRIA